MLVRVSTPGTKGFLQWTRIALPRTYRGIAQELQSSSRISGLGLVSTDPATTAPATATSSTLANTIREIAQVAGQVYLTREQMQAQQQILNLQLQRAQQGLPPLAIDPTTYGLPQPGFGVGLDSGTKQFITYGAIGVGVLWLLSMLTRRRHA